EVERRNDTAFLPHGLHDLFAHPIDREPIAALELRIGEDAERVWIVGIEREDLLRGAYRLVVALEDQQCVGTIVGKVDITWSQRQRTVIGLKRFFMPVQLTQGRRAVDERVDKVRRQCD